MSDPAFFALISLKTKKMGKAKFLSYRDLSAQKASNSGAMKILKDKGVNFLSNSQSQKFYGVLKDNKGDIRKALASINAKKDDGISSDVANKMRRVLGEEFDSGYKRDTGAAQRSGAGGSNVMPLRSNPVERKVGPQIPTSFAKTNANLSNSNLIKKAA